MVYRAPVGFRHVTDPQKLITLARIFISPMTPQDLRALIHSEPDFFYAGLMYDSLLSIKLRKRPRRNPVLCELWAAVDLKTWWFSQLTQETVDRLTQIYLRTAGKFLVNLTRNYPYKNNPPHIILRNGVPIWDVERVLKLILSGEAVAQIMRQINALGGNDHYYEVWIRQNHPTNPSRWDVVVTQIDDDLRKLREYGQEVEPEEKAKETEEAEEEEDG